MSVATPKQNNNPLFHAMVEAGVQAGYPRTDDLNGYQQEGFGPMDRTVTPQGRRASTARGYLDQARNRANLTIRTHAMTDHIILTANAPLASSGWKATAARRRKQWPIKKCCSAPAPSPRRKFSQRSGVGNPELLRQFDIPLVHALPGAVKSAGPS